MRLVMCTADLHQYTNECGHYRISLEISEAVEILFKNYY